MPAALSMKTIQGLEVEHEGHDRATASGGGFVFVKLLDAGVTRAMTWVSGEARPTPAQYQAWLNRYPAPSEFYEEDSDPFTPEA